MVILILRIAFAAISLFSAGMAMFYLRLARKYEQEYEQRRLRILKITLDSWERRTEAIRVELDRNAQFISKLAAGGSTK